MSQKLDPDFIFLVANEFYQLLNEESETNTKASEALNQLDGLLTQIFKGEITQPLKKNEIPARSLFIGTKLGESLGEVYEEFCGVLTGEIVEEPIELELSEVITAAQRLVHVLKRKMATNQEIATLSQELHDILELALNEEITTAVKNEDIPGYSYFVEGSLSEDLELWDAFATFKEIVTANVPEFEHEESDEPIDQDKLKASAQRLKQVLDRYASADPGTFLDLKYGLYDLIRLALVGKIQVAIGWNDIPFEIAFSEGEFREIRDLCEAYSTFKLDVTGSNF